MSWDDDDYEYSNGADGSCQTCGANTDESWHAYCRSCYAEQQGWTAQPEPAWREPRPPAGTPNESVVVGLAALRRELEEVRRRLERLEGAGMTRLRA